MEEKEGKRTDYKVPSINYSLYKTRSKTARNVLDVAAVIISREFELQPP